MTRNPRSVVRALVACVFVVTAAGTGAAPAAPDVRAPCDPLDKALCLLPFPNDRFTRPDPTTDTGRRIDFQLLEMPRTLGVKPIDPTEWNRNDGFSPGSMVLTFVPGLDLHRTWGTSGMTGDRVGGPLDPRDHIADIGRYTADDAPILIIDADTGQRWPFWSELDNNAMTKDTERMLILRPAVNFLEGHRYLVALRNLRDAGGNVIPAGAQFAAYRDGTPGPATDPTFEEARRTDVEWIIDEVAVAESGRGFERSELFLAWDFTIASERNLSERVLHIRDDAFGKLGDTNLADGVIQGDAPGFAVTTVTDRSADGARLRQVEGTITVPNYLTLPPQPPVEEISIPVDNPVGGSVPGQAIPLNRFFYGTGDLPMQNPIIPTIDVPFVCTIPKPLPEFNDGLAHPMLYGHGLLGSRFESTGGSSDRARERNFMPCAVNWMGFAEYDVVNAVVTLLDPSNMPSMIDRAQQGFLNFLYLGRALAHPQGLGTDPAFRSEAGQPLFRTGELVYDGNSQGAIMGGALTALAVDHTRAVLGVLGMNYSTLLNRSVDWEGPLLDPENPDIPSYSSLLYTVFPDKKEQQLVMAMIQMLWDRGEANGYAQHMSSDPLPNTPAHQVMLHAALGDFQVANVSAEVEARTIGARVMDTALMEGRHWEIAPYFGLTPMPRNGTEIAPWNGSALVYWDSGNLVPPNANVPPAEDGGDPHEDPRRDPRSGDQRRHFWLTGEIIDVFAGGPYLLCRPGQAANIPRVPSLFPPGFDWCV